MNRYNEIAQAASESMTETLMSTPNYEFSPRATDLLECAYIKGAEWADEHPKSPWHSVADGDLPKRDIYEDHTLIVFGEGIGFEYNVQYIAEDDCFGFSIFNGFDEEDTFEVLEGVEYWMEIPQRPKKGGGK